VSRWQVVFKKEFTELLRDPRVWIGSILVPLLITPLLLTLVGRMARSRVEDARTSVVTVGLVQTQPSETLTDALKGAELPAKSGGAGLRFVAVASRTEAEAQIKSRKLKAALLVPADAEEMARELRSIPLTVLKDSGSEDSGEAASRVIELLRERGERLVGVRLVEGGLPSQLARPFALTQKSVAGSGGASMAMLTVFLPYILAIYAVIGGASVAIDSVAGEKERGTLETLLVSPVSRREIVVGKFAAVVAATLLSSVLSLVGLIGRVTLGGPMLGMDEGADGGLKLSGLAMAAMFLVQVPLAVMGAGLLLMVSTFARNQKEASTYLMPLMMFSSIAAMMTMFLKASSPLWWAMVPVTNAALVLKQALEGAISPTFVALASVASILYAALAVWYATTVFDKESVLLKA
jgi:sodium transport system permease protein